MIFSLTFFLEKCFNNKELGKNSQGLYSAHSFLTSVTNLEVESNRTNFELIFIEFLELLFIFWINRIANSRIKSNKFQLNPTSVNLTPTYSWSRIERIKFELIFIKSFKYFLPFWINRIANFWIEWILNEFRF